MFRFTIQLISVFFMYTPYWTLKIDENLAFQLDAPKRNIAGFLIGDIITELLVLLIIYFRKRSS